MLLAVKPLTPKSRRPTRLRKSPGGSGRRYGIGRRPSLRRRGTPRTTEAQGADGNAVTSRLPTSATASPTMGASGAASLVALGLARRAVRKPSLEAAAAGTQLAGSGARPGILRRTSCGQLRPTRAKSGRSRPMSSGAPAAEVTRRRRFTDWDQPAEVYQKSRRRVGCTVSTVATTRCSNTACRGPFG